MQYGDEIAVTDSEKKITYLELNQKAICIGQYFMEKGICKDDKVLVQMPNRKVLERARYDYQVNKDKTLRNICRASKLDCFGTTGITKFV